MTSTRFTNIALLLSTNDFGIDNEALPADQKCTECRTVLKDAYQGPCGCKFCGTCISELNERGVDNCPCGEPLSQFVADFSINIIISRMIVRCSLNGCEHRCQLASMADHMAVCPRKSVECPFHELGCQTDHQLVAEEMTGHFQQEALSHNMILIREMSRFTRDMAAMQETLDEKDETIRHLLDQIGHVENENLTIKADLANTEKMLSLRIDETRANSEHENQALRDRVDHDVGEIRALIRSNKSTHDGVIVAVIDDIQSITQDNRSMKIDIESTAARVQSIQSLVISGMIDASCEWAIDADLVTASWDWSEGRRSDWFSGRAVSTDSPAYKYRLESLNETGTVNGCVASGDGGGGGSLWVMLCCCIDAPSAANGKSQLMWPFTGTVAMTVVGKSKRQQQAAPCWTITRPVEIRRLANNECSRNCHFKFKHRLLADAGIDLSGGVRVTCVIVPSGEAARS